MQERLGRDPFEALGLTTSDPGEVRGAFLRLTKIYHPARFARMSGDIQRLANEVFLALRAAHDTLSRAQVKVLTARQTGAVPIQRASMTGQRPATGAMPVFRPLPVAAPAPAANRPPPAPSTPPRTATGPASQPAPPAPAQPPARSAGYPAPAPLRPAPGAVARPGTSPTSPARPTAPGGYPITAAQPAAPRPPTPSTTQATQPLRPLIRLPSSSPAPPNADGSARFVVPTAGDPELAPILELLGQDRLTDARMKLEALVARRPNILQHQALIHYTKGREAQLARRIDEARVELMDALQLDPDLQLAKSALGELFTRRK